MKTPRPILFLASLVAVCTIAASGALAPVAHAEGPTNQAGLVVAFGDGRVVTGCVRFTEPQISGYEVLVRSGISFVAAQSAGIGAAICKIEDTGCEPSNCFCAMPDYWSYWHLADGAFVYSQAGASNYAVSPGAVEGWAWGGSAPPVMTLDQLCPAPATSTPLPTATPLPPTATPMPTETPLPTDTPQPTETPPPTDTPMPTDTPVPTDTPPPTDTPVPTDTPSPTDTPPPADTPAPPAETPEPVIADAAVAATGAATDAVDTSAGESLPGAASTASNGQTATAPPFATSTPSRPTATATAPSAPTPPSATMVALLSEDGSSTAEPGREASTADLTEGDVAATVPASPGGLSPLGSLGLCAVLLAAVILACVAVARRSSRAR